MSQTCTAEDCPFLKKKKNGLKVNVFLLDFPPHTMGRAAVCGTANFAGSGLVYFVLPVKPTKLMMSGVEI